MPDISNLNEKSEDTCSNNEQCRKKPKTAGVDVSKQQAELLTSVYKRISATRKKGGFRAEIQKINHHALHKNLAKLIKERKISELEDTLKGCNVQEGFKTFLQEKLSAIFTLALMKNNREAVECLIKNIDPTIVKSCLNEIKCIVDTFCVTLQEDDSLKTQLKELSEAERKPSPKRKRQ